MKVIAAYLLAVLGGNNSPSAHDIRTILGSVGVEADDDMIEQLLSQVKGKDLAQLIACGREKMASMPTGGIAAAGVPIAGGGGGSGVAPVAAKAEKEEKKEVVEESDEEMIFTLFDD